MSKIKLKSLPLSRHNNTFVYLPSYFARLTVFRLTVYVLYNTSYYQGVLKV